MGKSSATSDERPEVLFLQRQVPRHRALTMKFMKNMKELLGRAFLPKAL
jgi:hypothetical protein